jgi:hypothetical protein
MRSQKPDTCASDADCAAQGAGLICQPGVCVCAGQMVCVPGCASDNDCALGEQCAPTQHRCVPATCARDADCPPDFQCANGCHRRTCASDAACDGYCVEGQCYASLGTCEFPRP